MLLTNQKYEVRRFDFVADDWVFCETASSYDRAINLLNDCNFKFKNCLLKVFNVTDANNEYALGRVFSVLLK
jgi:hypothetical protein